MTTESAPSTTPTGSGTAASGEGEVEIRTPDFAAVQDEANGNPAAPISRFHDVQVSITAELGRARVPIRELLQLAPGRVIELNRSISSPVELFAHGVPLACGEVVVVQDCFAIRISEVYPSSSAGGTQS